MMNAGRLVLLVAVASVLSGCAGYSSVVNSLAPPAQKSGLLPDAEENKSMAKSAGRASFCARQELYMVMPEEDGKAGTVVVTFSDGKEEVLHGAYSALALTGDEKRVYVSNQGEMEAAFGTVVSALPKAPRTVRLYFQLGKDELTPESSVEAESIYQEIVARSVPEVLVVGHTDTVGTETSNAALSIRRAEKVRKGLIARGVPAGDIRVFGRGESELLVPTPDNTREPKNRRVEINVR